MLIECSDSLPVIFEGAVCASCVLMRSDGGVQETKQILLKNFTEGDLSEKTTDRVILLLHCAP